MWYFFLLPITIGKSLFTLPSFSSSVHSPSYLKNLQSCTPQTMSTASSGSRVIRRPCASADISWISAKICNCSGEDATLVEFRISMSELNPKRPYYKCRHCGYWEWALDSDLVKDGPPNNIGGVVRRVEVLEHQYITTVKIRLTILLIFLFLYFNSLLQ